MSPPAPGYRVSHDGNTFTVVEESHGGSSSSGSTRYTVSVEDTDNGSVKVSPTRASRGTTVTITVTAKVGEKVAFLVEGKQAGIFEARNIPADQLDPLLGIGCPNIIYPYLRANIADVITRAGFPPVHLAEINFEVFYQQRLQAIADAAAAAPAGDATTH